MSVFDFLQRLFGGGDSPPPLPPAPSSGAAMIIRAGPPSIRDPECRSDQTHCQRVHLSTAVWSQPGRIVYLSGLADADPQDPTQAAAVSLEIEVRSAVALRNALDQLLREYGYVR